MRDSNPLVSIIVITYNSAKFVLETLESAKAQTYQNIELIISDDCSTDDTVEICREWIDVNKGRFVRTELIIVEMNTGIPANCNRGVKSAKGEWVKLIAGDDALMIDCIETYIGVVNADSSKLVLFSNVYHYQDTFDENNKLSFYETEKLKISRAMITATEQFEILLRVNQIWAASLFFSKHVYDIVGYYDESLRLWEDKPMLLKISQNNIKLNFVHYTSCKYRLHTSSVQKKKNRELIQPFMIEASKYTLKNYVKYLPIYERVIYYLYHKNNIVFSDLFKNKKTIISNILFKSINIPLNLLRKSIINHYL